MKKINAFLVVILLIVFIIPSVAFASWWNPFSWHWGWLNSIFHFQQSVQQQNNQTAGWKTYVNSQYGFSVLYPAGSEISDNGNLEYGGSEIIFSLQNKKAVRIGIGNKDVFRGTPTADACDSRQKQENINGVVFYKSDVSPLYSGMTGEGAYATEYCTIKNGVHYKITLAVDHGKNSTYLAPETDADLNKIIQSFKFTTSANPTAGWKIYKDTAYGFEIQYPSTFNNYNPLPNFPPNPEILIQLQNNVGSYFVINSLDETGYYAKENLQNIIGLKTQYKPYEKIKIGNLDAYRFYIEQLGGGKNIETLIYDYPQKGKTLKILFEIQDSFFDSEVKIFEEIAKTFKFTNNNTVDWSKYTQDQLLSMVKKEPWYAEQTYYKGLVNNFLILDQGTAPYPRQLIIYDLTAKKEVLFDAYSVPLDITSNAVAYWNVTNQKITAENCPDSVQWIKEGLGAEIESHVSFDFLTLKPKELGQTRCRPTQ